MLNFFLMLTIGLLAASAMFFYPWLKQQRNLGILLTLLILIGAVIAYRYWGGSQGLQAHYEQQKQDEIVQEELKKYHSPQELIAALKKRVEAKKTDPKGWFLLARLYYAADDDAHAHEALIKANELKPHDTDIQLELARIDFKIHDQHFTPLSRALFQEVVAREPDNYIAVDFFAGSEFEAGHYESAIQLWRKLLMKVDPKSEDAALLERSIRRAQAKLLPERKIEVTIKLSPALRKRIKPGDTIFIFAKATDGSGSPIVVKKQKVTSFPMTVTLTNDDAMLPEDFLFLRFEELMVSARISHSETVSQNSEDIRLKPIKITFKSNAYQKVTLID